LASAGGTKSASVEAGSDILIAGLAVQVVTFGVFIVLAVKFHVRAVAQGKAGQREGWMKILGAIYVSSACILVSIVASMLDLLCRRMG
jgi:hypothetical protein